MAHLSAETSIAKDLLIELAESRLKESRVLVEADFAAASIYLGGYAVECYLKAAICKVLDLAKLPNTFKSHVLDLLLMHSGLKRRLSAEGGVENNFRKIAGLWKLEKTEEPIRYAPPANYGRHDADLFQIWLSDAKEGLIPWLRKQV